MLWLVAILPRQLKGKEKRLLQCPASQASNEEGAAVEPGKSGTPLFHVVETRDATPQRDRDQHPRKSKIDPRCVPLPAGRACSMVENIEAER